MSEKSYKGNIIVHFSPISLGIELLNESLCQFNSLLHKVYGAATAG
jgi:hypothetical protein